MENHREEIERYIAGVLDGSIVTGRLERLAVMRYQWDLERQADPLCPFEFKEAYANHAINFSKLCRQFESPFAGQILKLRPEQKFVVWNMFGWRQKSDGMRRFRHGQIEVARKSGKSTWISYLCCLVMFMDRPLERGAQVYVQATKQKQAKIVWRSSRKMIEQSPALKKRARITPSALMIEVPEYDNTFQPLAADKTPDGFNPSLVVKDEEHAYRERHREQVDTMGSGTGTRGQPLSITITTYGDDQSVIWIESHDYAVKCLESVVTGTIKNDTWFVFICALDYPNEQDCFRCKGENCPWCDGSGVITPDDPYNEAIWRKANPGIGPGIGHTPQLERMQELAVEAKGRPEKESEFFQKNLNIKVASRLRLLTPELVAACRCTLSDWKLAERIHGACDIGRSNDMFGEAIVARFDLVDDSGVAFRRFEARSHALTCEGRHDAISTAQVARWVESGQLGESNGDQVLFSEAEDWAVSQTAIYGIRTWAYDPSFGPLFGQRLQEVHGLTVFPFTQSAYHYNSVTRLLPQLMRKVHLVDGKVVREFGFDGDPVMEWMLGNLIVVKNAQDHWMPDKGASPQKIDIAVAVLMALSECLYSGEGGKSVYETRGFIEIG